MNIESVRRHVEAAGFTLTEKNGLGLASFAEQIIRECALLVGAEASDIIIQHYGIKNVKSD